MQYHGRKRIYSDIKLLNELLDYKLNSEEFMKNEKVVEVISQVVDELKNKDSGFVLFSAAHGLERRLILVACTNISSYNIYTWKAKEKIEKPFEATIHQKNAKINIEEFLSETCYGTPVNSDQLIQALLTESLTGYSINKNKALEFKEFVSKDGRTKSKQSAEIIEDKTLGSMILSGRRLTSGMSSVTKDTVTKIKAFAEKLSCEDLKLNISTEGIYSDRMLFGKIIDVRELDNRRYYQIDFLKYKRSQSPLTVGTVIGAVSAGTSSHQLNLKKIGNCWSAETKDYGSQSEYDVEDLKKIPYNFIDIGRPMIGIQTSSSTWKLFIGQDPRVDENVEEELEKEVQKELEKLAVNVDLDQTFVANEKKRNSYYQRYSSSEKHLTEELAPLQFRLKTLKRMVDEHHYLVKKKEAFGSDVLITDKIKYNHSEGKVSYNDFSIAINDELIKARLFESFDRYLVEFYRGNITEQEILDDLLRKTFITIEDRIQARNKSDFNIDIKINETIDLKIEGKTTSSKALLLYLNGQRFNKNELLEVIKEITCYRSQEEADRFIRNIGRLGLSVYIGITSGYEIEYPKEKGKEEEDGVKRIFKFRKLKGRSNYELILDTTHIPLKGKKLITMLYQKFNDEYVHDFFNKIDKYIFETCDSSLNYLKYRFLIDSSYDAFKNQSKEFLDKKVKDTESEYVRYFNKKSRQMMEGIKVKGLSGNNYIIAYDNKNSYVFIDPLQLEKKDEGLDAYKEGKYICMIDQSNIKSNIGYDTVVSKLLALKNDSSIAHTIYNLEEEIGE